MSDDRSKENSPSHAVLRGVIVGGSIGMIASWFGYEPVKAQRTSKPLLGHAGGAGVATNPRKRTPPPSSLRASVLAPRTEISSSATIPSTGSTRRDASRTASTARRSVAAASSR